MKSLCTLLAAAVVLCLSMPSWRDAAAMHPLVTDDSGTQGTGKFQLEFTGEYTEDRQRFLRAYGVQMQAALLYGVIDTLDVIVSFPYETSREYRYPWLGFFDHRPDTDDLLAWTSGDVMAQLALLKKTRSVTSGVADNAVEVKWRYFEHKALSLLFKPTITVPIGDAGNGLGAGRPTFTSVFGISLDLNPLAVHVNLGYQRNENTVHQKKDLWSASATVIWRPVKQLQLAIDGGLGRNPSRASRLNWVIEGGKRHQAAETPPAFVMAGIIYTFTEHFDLDAGFKYGITGTETDYTATAGIIIRY